MLIIFYTLVSVFPYHGTNLFIESGEGCLDHQAGFDTMIHRQRFCMVLVMARYLNVNN